LKPPTPDAAPPANLQVKRATVKDVARQTEMCERSVYKYREVLRLGRDDLIDQVVAGDMSVHRAWMIATGRKAPSSRDRLMKAWAAASKEDQAELVAVIWEMIESN
jgi:hypothetical protein